MKYKILVTGILFFLANLSVVAYSSEADKDFIIDQYKFTAWLKEFRSEALNNGISPQTLDKTFSLINPLEKVVALDKKQPEVKSDFGKYKSIILTGERIAEGRKLLKENYKLLSEISGKYRVQPRFIIALWGIETNYGKNTGDYHVPSALATLAFEGRRRDFFKAELINALKIIDGGHIAADKMKGSWAGAMGQSQFMPSSFLNFAADYNGDGHKDIWGTKEDVFASIANYLSKSGWNENTSWGRKVTIPKGFDVNLANSKANIDNPKTLIEWNKLGVRNLSGGKLPQRDLKAYLVFPGGEKNDAYLIYDNYKVVMKWNRSLYFATAVGLLSDAVDDKPTNR